MMLLFPIVPTSVTPVAEGDTVITQQPRREKYRMHKVGDKWRLLPP